jgi:hypothetical protein
MVVLPAMDRLAVARVVPVALVVPLSSQRWVVSVVPQRPRLAPVVPGALAVHKVTAVP